MNLLSLKKSYGYQQNPKPNPTKNKGTLYRGNNEYLLLKKPLLHVMRILYSDQNDDFNYTVVLCSTADDLKGNESDFWF